VVPGEVDLWGAGEGGVRGGGGGGGEDDGDGLIWELEKRGRGDVDRMPLGNLFCMEEKIKRIERASLGELAEDSSTHTGQRGERKGGSAQLPLSLSSFP